MNFKFLIDENITPALLEVFHQEGIIAHHVNQLKAHKNHRIIDDTVRRLAMDKAYIIVTKDDDFVKSYVDRKVPDKMIFVYGLETKETLIDRFKREIHQILSLLALHDFIEVNPQAVRVPFS